MPMTAQVQNPKAPPAQEGEKLSPMGNSSASTNPSHQILLQEEPNNTQEKKSNKLRLIPLIFLIYFEVSGGPFGEEPAVQAAGPLLAILGFLIFPFIWSVPEALITAELSTTFPGNGGYVIWATRAFGPFWGSMMGSWKYLSGAINSAAFPALCADYLKQVFPIFSGGVARSLLLALFNIFLTFLNYTGLTVVGYTSVALGTISLFPFVLMGIFSIPKLHPRRWIGLGDKHKDWNGFFNTLFWNLNYWDNASTLAGEVDGPHKTYPKALLFSCLLACIGYLIPLLAATGALEVDQQQWSGGFLAVAAGKIAGNWLKYWVEIGSVLSSIGLFEAQLSSCAYQIEGMAELGFLPRFAGSRSAWFDTPWVGILATGLISLGLSFVSFDKIIDSANFMYSLGMFLEFASFVWLRKKYPALERPYKVPVGIPGLVCMCLIPSGFLVFILVIAGRTVMLISCGLTVLGVVGYFAMGWLKKKAFLEFNKDEGIVVVEAS